jgi:hypothetical protein
MHRVSVLIDELFHFLHPPVEFLIGALAGVAILLLEQADDFFGIASRLFQVTPELLHPY